MKEDSKNGYKLSEVQSKVAGHYYALFYSFFQKQLRKFCGKKYVNMNDPVTDELYTNAINGFFKSVINFSYNDLTAKDLWRSVKSGAKKSEIERKFINYVYNNMTFHFMNYFAKAKKDKERIPIIHVEPEAYEELPMIKDVFSRVESDTDMSAKINRFLEEKENMKKIEATTEKKRQIAKHILESFFTPDNCEFIYASEKLTRCTIRPIIDQLFNNRDTEIMARNNYRSFKYMAYDIIKAFCQYS